MANKRTKTKKAKQSKGESGQKGGSMSFGDMGAPEQTKKKKKNK